MNEKATTETTDIHDQPGNFSRTSILINEIDKTFGHVAQMIMQGKEPRHNESVLIRIEQKYHMTMGIDPDEFFPVAVSVFAAMYRGGGDIHFHSSPVSLKDIESVALLIGDDDEKAIREESRYAFSAKAIGCFIAHHQLSEVIADNQEDNKAYAVNIENIFNVLSDCFQRVLVMSRTEGFDDFNKGLYRLVPNITGLRTAVGSEDLRDQVAMSLGRIIDTFPESCSANPSGGGEHAN